MEPTLGNNKIPLIVKTRYGSYLKRKLQRVNGVVMKMINSKIKWKKNMNW
jgi:hypothetical protein